MRRRFLAALVAFSFGVLAFASDASACCHKKKACATPCAAPAPCPEPAPCAPKKKCGGGLKLFKGCHKKKACAPVCAAPAPTCAPCGEYAPAPSAQWVPPTPQS